MTHTTDAITYSSVVTRETVCIAFTMAVPLEVKAVDILNAYVMAPNRERIWTVLGAEFGEDTGKSTIIVRVLYCLTSASASCKAHFAQCMWE